jgi:hypothetical protein
MDMTNFSIGELKRRQILAGFGMADDISKAEGSKGGQVLGHTPAGKPIYASHKLHDLEAMSNGSHRHLKEHQKYHDTKDDLDKDNKTTKGRQATTTEKEYNDMLVKKHGEAHKAYKTALINHLKTHKGE